MHWPIVLRRLRAGDAQAAYRLRQRAVHVGAAEAYTAAERAAWAPAGPMPDGWPDRFADALAWIAVAGPRLAGFVAAGRDGHIDLLYTDPDFARRGVASRLCDRAEAALARAGCRVLTTEASLLARPFFEARGWRVEARQSPIRRGVALTSFRMTRTLAPDRAPSPRR